MKRCVQALIIILAFPTVALAALNVPPGAPGPHAGRVPYIEVYDGPAKAYRIVHQAKTLSLTPLLILSPGDTVMVVQATDPERNDLPNHITLYDGERTVELSSRNGAYCIGGVSGVCGAKPRVGTGVIAEMSTIVQNVFQSAGRFLGVAEDSKHSSFAQPAGARGANTTAPIVVPLLETAGQRLVAGQRALSLEWKGGEPPFRVALYRAASPAALETVDAADRAARFPERAIPAGNYRFEIADNAGNRTDAAFEAVPGADLPAPTADENVVDSDDSLPAPVRTTLGAIQLVQHEPLFGFEAYQRVAELASTYRPADLLRYYLANPD